MKKYFLPLLITLVILGSCETEEQIPDQPQVIKKEKITGFVQKGPFVSGTNILMNELNPELVQTGKIFTATIINDMGLFELNNIELNSRFVEFTASGFYFNEVSGEISNSPLALTTLSDIDDKNTINVNVLTHLEKRRVETLLKEGKSFAEAKTQSRDELLSVFSMSINNNASFEEFDISKNTEEGSVLLGISVLLQGNRSVGQLTELLSRIQNDFSDNGKLDDENILNFLRTSSIELDFEAIRGNIEKRFQELNNNSPVPDFESQIRKFLNSKNLIITIDGDGTVKQRAIINPSGREYPNGTIVELTPVPDDGWEFESWGGDLSGNQSPQIITIDEEKNVTVKFKRKDYLLNITIEGEGNVEERIVTDPNGRSYPFQTVVELTPIAKEGWVFESWGGDLSGNDMPQTITVDKERNVTVIFRNPIFRLSENGVTCICENVKVGDKGFINGIEYEAVDNELLRKRRDEKADMNKLCTSLVTDMGFLFSGTFNQPIGNWDVSNVTTMDHMFAESSFNQPIGNWDVSNVKNMRRMFDGTPFNQPIGNWNVGNVTDMETMFQGTRFNQAIGDWDVSKVTKMARMFSSTPFNQPIGNWDVGMVTDMAFMFAGSTFNQPIGNWDVSKVTTMREMFTGTQFNQNIGDWNVENVVNMSFMFNNSQFNQPIGNWNVGKVTDMSHMFADTPFNQPIGDWNVGSLINMFRMFGETPFNQPIGNWDVSNVTNMRNLFAHSQFNQPIGDWDVGNVTIMHGMFRGTQFNQPIGKWDVSNVFDMSEMFQGTPFNHSIVDWNVGSVTTMEGTFFGTQFNQPIGNWNVSNVSNMRNLFRDTPFNQNISNWCVKNINTEPQDFSTGSPLTSENKPKWGTCPD